jgi:hypothetical protein
LAIYFALALSLAGRQSMTGDEAPHLGAGLRYWEGDNRLNREHPPLTKLIAASLLPPPGAGLARDPRDSVLREARKLGVAYVHESGKPPLAVLFRARLPLVVVGSVLVLLVGLWSLRLAGLRAGLFAPLLLATSALWLAHSTLVTTDGAVTTCFFGANYCLFQVLRAEGRRRAARLGIVLFVALGLACKYSMVAAALFMLLALLFEAIVHREFQRSVEGGVLVVLGMLVGICFSWGWPPRPELYFAGVGLVGANHNPHHMFYAFGDFFPGRDLLYFARALLVKLPLVVACAALVLPWLGYRLRRREDQPVRRGLVILVLPATGYFLLMSAKAPAIGVRYVLPVLPYLIVAAATSLAKVSEHRLGRWALIPLSLVQAADVAVAMQASPLAHFNGLGCVTGQTLPCLDDSNLDWGQSLPALGEYRDRHYPGEPLRVLYFGVAPVSSYIHDAVAAKDSEILAPEPALYAVSLHLALRYPEGTWPRRVAPLAVVAGVYAIYDWRQVPTSVAPTE